ncbi:hypothetical protein E2C01_060810 [Portunus trituberculatus]|uniref:Uncharacterized protein n=1 Tax=Portunus trituberculatus TaxID=210409 RepID=A0A5B7H3K8_PORTR|nr:hypothetical protein [Portunus trituberculatus]
MTLHCDARMSQAISLVSPGSRVHYSRRPHHCLPGLGYRTSSTTSPPSLTTCCDTSTLHAAGEE